MKTLAGIGNVSDIGHTLVVYFLIACAGKHRKCHIGCSSLRIQYLHEFFEMFLGYTGQYLILGRPSGPKVSFLAASFNGLLKNMGNIEISECILTICCIFW